MAVKHGGAYSYSQASMPFVLLSCTGVSGASVVEEQTLTKLISSMWFEVAIFLVAFAVVRTLSSKTGGKGRAGRGAKKIDDASDQTSDADSSDKLSVWAQRVVGTRQKDAALDELIGHLAKISLTEERCNSAKVLLGVLVDVGKSDLVDDLVLLCRERFGLELNAETIAVQLEQCAKRGDVAAAAAMETSAKASGVAFTATHYELLLKCYSRDKEGRCLATYAAMQASGFTPCEGLCRFLISRSAETRNLDLAVKVADDLRSRKEMFLGSFKALMKAYANSNLHDKACDLYAELQEVGIEPDPIMYSSFIKFAAKAGRKELLQELFDNADWSKMEDGVQNFMWFLRSAGQEGNVEKAVSVFRKMQQTRPELVDAMAFNAVIDACISNGNMEKGLAMLEEMRNSSHSINVVTYNILIKAHALVGDLGSARALLRDMDASAVSPDSASFSCLLNCATKAGSLDDVWDILADLDRRGLPFDSYVLTAAMQATRKAGNARDASRLLTILNRPGIDICKDEVVFNTVLDACICCRDQRRLQCVVDKYASSSLQPSVRTFGLLIRACSLLRCTARCAEFWEEMVGQRGLIPNDITLGCMIDALVEAHRVDEAMALFQKWKGRVSCDTIVYSTLIKGCANSGDAERAMDLYAEMRAKGICINHIVYSSLINAQARNGSLAKAEEILEEMQRQGCQANAITYSGLVKGHCVRGDLEAALALFQRMIKSGVVADTVVFNTLLDGCVQQARWELADELLSQMQRQGLAASNFTLSIVIKMWSKRRCLDKAFACMRAALKDPSTHGRVDSQVGACIVGACMHNRAPDRALEVFEEMKTWSEFDGPDANTYSALISGLPRHGRVRKAAQLAEEACFALRATARGQNKRLLAPNALQQLYGALRNEGLIEDLGVPLARHLRAAGMRVEAQWLALH